MPLGSYYLILKLLALEGKNNINTYNYKENNFEVQLNEAPDLISKLDKLYLTITNEVKKINDIREQEFKNLKLFIDEVNMFGFSTYDLTKESGVGVRHIDYVLEGTSLEGLGEYYIKAEKEYGVNAFFLIGLSALESAWGNSRLANDRNNVFGFMAYDRNVDMAKRFETKGDSILYVAKYLKNNYLTVGGKYYNGVTLKDVNVSYSSDDYWHKKIDIIVRKLVYDLQFGIENGLIKE